MFDVVGQEVSKKAFKRALENNKIAHAYILTGPDGVGKSIFALHMASALLCSKELKPCGTCSFCRKILNMSHPDVKVISKGEKSIVIDDIRAIIDEINTKPYEGSRKIIIIKNADNITVQGQNALLKTLEEPPKDTTIIMLASNSNSILPTIQSRCQTLRFGRIPIESIREYLISEGINRDSAYMAAGLSDGILGKALEFLDEKYLKLRNDTIAAARNITRANSADIMDYADFFIKNKEKIDIILDIMITWYRDIMLLKLTKNKELIMNLDNYELLVEESRLISYNKLNDIIDVIKNSKENLKQNSNFQLTMEVMLLKIQEV